MAERRKLSEEEVQSRIGELSGWTLAAGKLHRELKFANFVTAFGFMSSLALIAESMDHHPEWFNVYGRVVIDLSTHDLGGISELDFELARAIDSLAAE